MAYTYANLKNPRNTGSGVADYVLLAPVSDFLEGGIKCPTGPFIAPGDEVLVTESHVFKTGKKFVQYLLAPQKNQLNATTIGDMGFQKLDFSLEIFLPGSYAEVHEAVKNIINTPLIVLVKDSNCDANMYYQLGCDCVFAYARFDFSTGTTNEGVKGYTGTITYQNGYVQLYKGALTTGGGVPPAGSFTSYWGWVDAAEDAPATAAAIEASANSAIVVSGSTIAANYTANTDPKFLWMAEPIDQPAKTKWYVDNINNGDIGPSELFETTVFDGYRLYLTSYATTQTEGPIQFRVS